MHPSSSHPALRLVASEEGGWWTRGHEMQAAVARENRGAAAFGLDPADARWVLAANAHAQLQGSAMTPERRERVMRLATRLGVRPFDASVIIAIVQDHARRGADLGDAVPTLTLVTPAVPPPARREWLPWLASAAAALAGSALLIWWLLG